ncbi:hypothetical protein Tco_0130095, partial [Tanacetum coccineum]
RTNRLLVFRLRLFKTYDGESLKAHEFREKVYPGQLDSGMITLVLLWVMEIMSLVIDPGPAPNLLTPGPISSGLVPNPAPVLPYVPPTSKELEMLFQPMFDEVRILFLV